MNFIDTNVLDTLQIQNDKKYIHSSSLGTA